MYMKAYVKIFKSGYSNVSYDIINIEEIKFIVEEEK